MAQIGTEEGHLDPMEAEFIHNLMHFKKYKVREVMTPRTVIFSAPQEMTFKEFYDSKEEHIFSRIPLRESATSENIIGFVLKDDVLDFLVNDEDHKKLSEIRRDIIIVQHSYSIFQLFTDFITKREHIALVVDEYGSTQGLVTMEDVVETLLGSEIVDETDQVVDMQDHAKKNWARLKTRSADSSKTGKLPNKNRASNKEETKEEPKKE